MNPLTFDEIYIAHGVINTQNVVNKLQIEEMRAEGRQREAKIERERGKKNLFETVLFCSFYSFTRSKLNKVLCYSEFGSGARDLMVKTAFHEFDYAVHALLHIASISNAYRMLCLQRQDFCCSEMRVHICKLLSIYGCARNDVRCTVGKQRRSSHFKSDFLCPSFSIASPAVAIFSLNNIFQFNGTVAFRL